MSTFTPTPIGTKQKLSASMTYSEQMSGLTSVAATPIVQIEVAFSSSNGNVCLPHLTRMMIKKTILTIRTPVIHTNVFLRLKPKHLKLLNLAGGTKTPLTTSVSSKNLTKSSPKQIKSGLLWTRNAIFQFTGTGRNI